MKIGQNLTELEEKMRVSSLDLKGHRCPWILIELYKSQKKEYVLTSCYQSQMVDQAEQQWLQTQADDKCILSPSHNFWCHHLEEHVLTD